MKKSHSFAFEANYSISHEPKGTEKTILICFHGYGQLAEFFIKKFLPFANEDLLVIAPEGTNYQYLRDFSGRVGANWMTKHERELAIRNNHVYLDSLMESILNSFSKKPKIVVLGFSQGVATSTRWLNHWGGRADSLILWAGVFAHDMQMDLAKEKFKDTRMMSVFGDQDEFVTAELLQKQRDFLDVLGKKVEEYQFSGGHEISEHILNKVMTDMTLA